MRRQTTRRTWCGTTSTSTKVVSAAMKTVGGRTDEFIQSHFSWYEVVDRLHTGTVHSCTVGSELTSIVVGILIPT